LLFAMNLLLPRARVRVEAAAAGALVSAVLLELAKVAFAFYVEHLLAPAATRMYGALGLLPIFLVWTFYGWVVVLVGAVTAYTVQNLEHLERADRRARGRGRPGRIPAFDGARALLAVARAQRGGHGALP